MRIYATLSQGCGTEVGGKSRGPSTFHTFCTRVVGQPAMYAPRASLELMIDAVRFGKRSCVEMYSRRDSLRSGQQPLVEGEAGPNGRND